MLDPLWRKSRTLYDILRGLGKGGKKGLRDEKKGICKRRTALTQIP
jgi:hypothetical protein